jgi:cell division protein FtsB
MAREQPAASLWKTTWGTCVSFAFWTCLLVSVACFAAVALAPKYVQWARLNEQYTANQRRLAEFERQTLQLKKVADALENDPAFAEELARVEFDAVRPGEEVLPVESALQLDPQASLQGRDRTKFPADSWMPAAVVLAQEQDVRAALLLAAAVLAVVAFTWLHDLGEHGRTQENAAPRRSWRQRLAARYRAS